MRKISMSSGRVDVKGAASCSSTRERLGSGDRKLWEMTDAVRAAGLPVWICCWKERRSMPLDSCQTAQRKAARRVRTTAAVMSMRERAGEVNVCGEVEVSINAKLILFQDVKFAVFDDLDYG